MKTWPTRIAVIGDTNNGEVRLLQLGLCRWLTNAIINVFPNRASLTRETNTFDAIFVNLNQTNDIPTQQIESVFELIAQNLKIPIYVALGKDYFQQNNSPFSFSPPQILALLLSGVSGVWEISPHMLTTKPHTTPEFENVQRAWQRQEYFLYGSFLTDFYQFHKLVTGYEWPRDPDERESLSTTQERYCFQVAMSMATLSTEQMTIDDSSNAVALYAQRFKQLESESNCIMGLTLIEKCLRYLNHGWEDRIATYDRKKRNLMPIWAKEDGFSAIFPTVRGKLPSDVPKLVFDAITQMTFDVDDQTKKLWAPTSVEGSLYTTIRFRSNL